METKFHYAITADGQQIPWRWIWFYSPNFAQWLIEGCSYREARHIADCARVSSESRNLFPVEA